MSGFGHTYLAHCTDTILSCCTMLHLVQPPFPLTCTPPSPLTCTPPSPPSCTPPSPLTCTPPSLLTCTPPSPPSCTPPWAAGCQCPRRSPSARWPSSSSHTPPADMDQVCYCNFFLVTFYSTVWHQHIHNISLSLATNLLKSMWSKGACLSWHQHLHVLALLLAPLCQAGLAGLTGGQGFLPSQ